MNGRNRGFPRKLTVVGFALALVVGVPLIAVAASGGSGSSCALMQPGAVRFASEGPADSFSFTWVLSISPFEANDHHVFDVEWRSPSGRTTTLERGTINLQYQLGTHRC